MTYALHFGVYSEDSNMAVQPTFGGTDDPTTEHPFLVQTFRDGQRQGFVSGSWKCWGTPDQDAEGDMSLHLLVLLRDDEEVTPALVEAIRDDLWERVAYDCRLLDYAIVTTVEDWSDVRAIVTSRGGTYAHNVKGV